MVFKAEGFSDWGIFEFSNFLKFRLGGVSGVLISNMDLKFPISAIGLKYLFNHRKSLSGTFPAISGPNNLKRTV